MTDDKKPDMTKNPAKILDETGVTLTLNGKAVGKPASETMTPAQQQLRDALENLSSELKPASPAREFWILWWKDGDEKQPRVSSMPCSLDVEHLVHEEIHVIEISALAEAEKQIANLQHENHEYGRTLKQEITALQEKLAVAEGEHYEEQQRLFDANKRIADWESVTKDLAKLNQQVLEERNAALAEVEREKASLKHMRIAFNQAHDTVRDLREAREHDEHQVDKLRAERDRYRGKLEAINALGYAECKLEDALQLAREALNPSGGK